MSRRALARSLGAVAFAPLTLRIYGARATDPKRSVDRIADRWTPPAYRDVELAGLFGERFARNAERRLLAVDLDAMLEPFERRDDKNHPWVGEHIGKFLDAASQSLAVSDAPELRARAQLAARRLLATQQSDGYLGTYTASKRWTSWDVWTHKYALLGLLSYHAVFEDDQALTACRRIGDLLVATFGESSSQRDIVRAGEHVGMAATSVLEPICGLFRRTGEARYLEFAEYIVRAYEQAHGPKLVSALLDHGTVYRTANTKAYEMLSNFNGMLDLYRANGDERLLQAVLRGWDDIVQNELYPTGTMSAHERFQGTRPLLITKSSNVGEACVTVTWLQLNQRLLRLTGEPRFAQQIERTVYNALFAAQDSATGNVCYYTPLCGQRDYTRHQLCCVSSMPRGIALLPGLFCGTEFGGIAIHQYTAGRATLDVQNTPVGLSLHTNYPRSGSIALDIRVARPTRFALRLRVPDWATRFTVRTRGQSHEGTPGTMLSIEQHWHGTTRLVVELALDGRLQDAERLRPDSVVVMRGPQLLSLDRTANPLVPAIARVALVEESPTFPLTADSSPDRYQQVVELTALPVSGSATRLRQSVRWVPFADALDGNPLVARPGKSRAAELAVSTYGRAGLSTWGVPDFDRPLGRASDVAENLVDDNPATYCQIDPRNGGPGDARGLPSGQRDDPVFAYVVLDRPALITRFAFQHGAFDADGGWFDTLVEKPRIEVVRGHFPMVEDTFPDTGRAHWEPLATLDAYPATTAQSAPADLATRRIELRLTAPVSIAAFRLIGRAARQHVTLAELAAFA